MSEVPPRLDFLEYGILMAYAASNRATCRRRMVGCALFGKNKVVVATGYNGAPRNAPQCDEVGCLLVDGHCRRINHAEKNAVIFAGHRELSGGYSFGTISPCADCLPLLISTGIKKVFYLEEYRLDSIAAIIQNVCAPDNVEVKKLDFSIPDLIQKSFVFHQSSGGLLTLRYKLRVVEDIPEIIDH